MQHRVTARIATGLLIAALAPAVYGQSARSGGSSPGSSTAQQVIAQMQQVAQERTQAQAEASKAKLDLAAAQDELKKLKAEYVARKAEAISSEQLVRAQREAQQASADLERVRGNVNELTRQLRESALQLRESETERAILKSDLAAGTRTQATCTRDNAELSALTLDILSRYEKHFGHTEPFFKIGQVRAHNLADEYRSKVDDLKAPSAASAEPNAH
ncbi:MAG: hypothetical protein WCP04_06540 [Pseudomonadota bacterium]